MLNTSRRHDALVLAVRLMRTQKLSTREEAAGLALKQLFGLQEGDGIWGGSTAAAALEFRGHKETKDLLPLIAADLAASLPPTDVELAGSQS